MKFIRTANANWKGTGKEGKGTLSTQSKTLDSAPYSFHTRFEDGKGTNPEELVGAAHAGCYTMKLSFLLSNAGFVPNNLSTEAKVLFEDGAVTQVELNLQGEVDGIEEGKFVELAEEAKMTCPISKLLNTEIVLNTKLISFSA
ncbi:MAG: OsmC family protein [Chitinophagales bacterium]|nr:OsmC family protein [Chitinophagales bacterium]